MSSRFGVIFLVGAGAWGAEGSEEGAVDAGADAGAELGSTAADTGTAGTAKLAAGNADGKLKGRCGRWL